MKLVLPIYINNHICTFRTDKTKVANMSVINMHNSLYKLERPADHEMFSLDFQIWCVFFVMSGRWMRNV